MPPRLRSKSVPIAVALALAGLLAFVFAARLLLTDVVAPYNRYGASVEGSHNCGSAQGVWRTPTWDLNGEPRSFRRDDLIENYCISHARSAVRHAALTSAVGLGLLIGGGVMLGNRRRSAAAH
ncbi:hypothetical protein [Mumia sp. Pv 4-285]|uniref:hypothetical protein n=1 Tax=Mumia qirimensis TaxID=3234852 RepID=UPI00351CDF60